MLSDVLDSGAVEGGYDVGVVAVVEAQVIARLESKGAIKGLEALVSSKRARLCSPPWAAPGLDSLLMIHRPGRAGIGTIEGLCMAGQERTRGRGCCPRGRVVFLSVI